jgi:hypothetical protein
MRTLAVLACVAAVGLSAGSLSAGASTRRTDHLRAPAITELPVTACTTSYGVQPPPSPFVPSQLPTTSVVHGLSYYSNGRITVLGPAGWACGALVAADGGQDLDVYPPGKPDYATSLAPKGARVVQVEVDYTGHLPGAELVCALFPNSAAAAEVKSVPMPCPIPSGEKTTALTPDVVTFIDPPGTSGSGAGSGGSLASKGASVYPQLSSTDSSAATDSVTVARLSCTLPKKSASLCAAIEGDFVVRNPPAYVPQSG